MTVTLIICGLLVLGLLCWLVRLVYLAGYTQGQIDQTREDSQKFLQAVERREKN